MGHFVLPSFSILTLVAAVTASSAKKSDSAPRILEDMLVLAEEGEINIDTDININIDINIDIDISMNVSIDISVNIKFWTCTKYLMLVFVTKMNTQQSIDINVDMNVSMNISISELSA